MIVALKLVHMAAIAIWSAGLLCLPALYVRRGRTVAGPSFHRLHGMVRYLYVTVLSPAAFVAIASGTALIFARETFEPWFSLKLLLVGAMVSLHVLTGLLVIRLFAADAFYPVWRSAGATLASLSVISAILAVVLAKPDLPHLLPAELGEPGALRRLAEPINPFQK
ncbi:CopD family protein [Zavarzinia sp. CC-PAN008]|uniref:CopD family protein n=1 Tax=Zavarzinia sp. CC-PAN008 TaxID=3243332 RepID=UPI003F742289